jgi:UDP-N-acetylglucosamine 2-epimerase (non-hydrolysing)
VRVAVVLGTRPEAIKLAPVIDRLQAADGVETLVVSTGQHSELLEPMLALFGIEPDVDLGVMRPRQDLGDLTATLVSSLGAVLRTERPHWVLVQGDTTTTLSAALAAFYEGIAVGHVEAGLRTRDLRAPFPEEANRRLAGALASFHFCPTQRNAENLRGEGVPDDRVLVTGNTGIDALLWAVDEARRLPPPITRRRERRILVTLHRREAHGEPMHRLCDVLGQLAARGDTELILPVHRNPAVQDVLVPRLRELDGVHLCEPLDYLSLVHVLDSCDLVVTDSGGLQEEAPTLGKPVLVARETTERHEAVEAGVARLVGTDPATLLGAATELLDDAGAYAAMARPANPFGDGAASARIVAALLEHRRREIAA